MNHEEPIGNRILTKREKYHEFLKNDQLRSKSYIRNMSTLAAKSRSSSAGL